MCAENIVSIAIPLLLFNMYHILGTLNVLRAGDTENKTLSLPSRSFQSKGKDNVISNNIMW